MERVLDVTAELAVLLVRLNDYKVSKKKIGTETVGTRLHLMAITSSVKQLEKKLSSV